jgi:hypothetical protein
MIPIAVGLAAVASPSAFWEGTVFVLALLLLFAAIIGMIYRRGRDRAFWLGFSLFGWGFYLLCLTSSPVSYYSGDYGETYHPYGETYHPVRTLIRSLVDGLRLGRRLAPKSVGEKVRVAWPASGSYYYTCFILEIREGEYKIRYDSDPSGTSDEWVGINRMKLEDLDQSYRTGEVLFGLLFAIAGAIIARLFFATGKSGSADKLPQRTVPPAASPTPSG